MAKTKGKYRKYSEEDLISAIDDIEDGMSKNAASKKWNVPKTTIIDTIQEKYSG